MSKFFTTFRSSTKLSSDQAKILNTLDTPENRSFCTRKKSYINFGILVENGQIKIF